MSYPTNIMTVTIVINENADKLVTFAIQSSNELFRNLNLKMLEIKI